MSAKRRVYEVARDLGLDNKALLGVLESLGVQDVKNHMSVLSTDDEDRIKKHLGRAGSGRAGSGAGSGGAASGAAGGVSAGAGTISDDGSRAGRVVVRGRRTEDGVTEEAAVGPRAASSPGMPAGSATSDSSGAGLASGSPTVVRRAAPVVRRP